MHGVRGRSYNQPSWKNEKLNGDKLVKIADWKVGLKFYGLTTTVQKRKFSHFYNFSTRFPKTLSRNFLLVRSVTLNQKQLYKNLTFSRAHLNP